MVRPTNYAPRGIVRLVGTAGSGLVTGSSGTASPGTSGNPAGTTWKAPVRVATTANGALATAYENGDTVDGIVLATGNRILIRDQVTQAENGIYTVNASGAPTRASDMDDNSEVVGAIVFVLEGTANGEKTYRNTNATAPIIGTDAITFAEFASGVTDHGTLTGLTDDDHPQYVPITTGAYRFLDHGNPGASETIDFGAANVHRLDLDQNLTSLTLSGAVSTRGGSPATTEGVLYIIGNGFSVTWPGSVDWGSGGAPTLASGLNVILLLTVNGGTNWQAFLGGSGGSGGSLDDLSDVTITSPSLGDRLRYNGAGWVNSQSFPEVLISDTPSTPLVFADLIQNEAQDDLVYADP